MIVKRMMCLLVVATCMTPFLAAPCKAQNVATVHAEIQEMPYLYEVVRHLYRWYMDEADAEKIAGTQEWQFWVRNLSPALDEGDKSAFGEIVLPQLGITVSVKKSDYAVEELDLVVKSEGFKIVRVSRTHAALKKHKTAVVLKAEDAVMRKHLFDTRMKLEFPQGEFLDRLRAVARASISREYAAKDKPLPEGDPVIHLSSISPVANELWVFWESGRMLIRFASDIDLSNPDVWKHEELAVKSYDLDEQVVVSLHEVPGSNAYLTRDQVGRALFNCVVLGKRVELPPPPKE